MQDVRQDVALDGTKFSVATPSRNRYTQRCKLVFRRYAAYRQVLCPILTSL